MAVGASAIRAGRAFVEIFADDSKLVRGLRGAQSRLKKFGQSATMIGRTMMASSAVVAAPIAFATRTFMGFEDQMKSVQAVTGATADEFQRLYEQAKLLGRTTSFTAGQVGGGQLNLARAGFSPAEIEAAIPSVLNLARATGTDLSMAAEIAAGTLRAFSMEANEMTRVADVMVATANNSAQTLEELGESMKYVAPVAEEFGLSVEDTSKSLGVLANMQIKGSLAGTSLRRAMVQLAKPDVQERLREMGVETLDATGNFRGLGDIMVDLGNAMAGLSNAERIGLAAELFDVRAFGSVLKLAKSDFPALSSAIDNAAGTADRTARVMDSGLGGAFRRMMSAIEGVQVAIGETLNPSLSKAGDLIAALSGMIVGWINNNKDTVTTVVAITAVVFGLGTALVATGLAFQLAAFAAGGLAIAASAVGAVFAGIGALVAVVITPVGMLATSVIAASAAFLYFSGTLADVVSGSVSMLGEMAGIFTTTIGGIVDALRAGNAQAAADIMWKGLHLAWMKGIQPLKEAWVGFQIWFTEITTGLAGVLIDAVAMMKSAWTSGINSMRKAWESFAASGFTEGAADIIAPIMAKIYGVDTEDVRANLKQDFQRKREDLPGKLAEIDAETEASKDEIEQQRQNRRAALEANRQRSQEDAGEEMARMQRELAEAEKALTDAREEAKDAVDAEGGRDAIVDKAKQRIPALLDGMGASQEKAQSIGTFSAATAARLGGGDRMLDLAQKQLNEQREIARNTRGKAVVMA